MRCPVAHKDGSTLKDRQMSRRRQQLPLIEWHYRVIMTTITDAPSLAQSRHLHSITESWVFSDLLQKYGIHLALQVLSQDNFGMERGYNTV